MGVEIPLFELSVVLFPHMPLPLHVFEERYRTMLRDCNEQGVSFGVVGIREGVEVVGEIAGVPMTGAAHAFDVGTLARIGRQETLEDGRSNLLVTGATRFRVVRRIGDRPYPAGEVEYLSDAGGDPAQCARLVAEVLPAFRRYAATLRELASPHPPAVDDLSDEPELLSYLVAAGLHVELGHKQRLLEADSAEERLRLCAALLRREEALLDRSLARTTARISGISPN